MGSSSLHAARIVRVLSLVGSIWGAAGCRHDSVANVIADADPDAIDAEAMARPVDLEPEVADAGDPDGSPTPGAELPRPGTTPRKYRMILHLGDSMVGARHGLSQGLETRFKKHGAKFRTHPVTSAQIQGFEREVPIATLIQSVNPDVVILNLGTNNVRNPYPDKLSPSIRSIVKKMAVPVRAGGGGRECYWLGPPLPINGFAKDTGIRKAIADNVAPCKFIDASLLEIERRKDRVHPTLAGGDAWAAAVYAFIVSGEASHSVRDDSWQPLGRPQPK